MQVSEKKQQKRTTTEQKSEQNREFTYADAFGEEIEQIYRKIYQDLGEKDVKHIEKLIRFSKKIHKRGREKIANSRDLESFWKGIGMLGGHYVMEFAIGHMVMHGCYDDLPGSKIHSSTWKWNNSMAESDWIVGHNQYHHTHTNVIGEDHDFGFLVFRVNEKQKWNPLHLLQTPVFLGLPLFVTPFMSWFVTTSKSKSENKSFALSNYTEAIQNTCKVFFDNYFKYPLQAGSKFPKVLLGNALAKLYANIIFIYMLGVEHLNDNLTSYNETPDRSRGEYYLRQILSTLNYTTDEKFAEYFLGGINIHTEHHLFPDLPPNRLAEAAKEVKKVCKKYDVPYRSLPWEVAIAELLYTVIKYSLPFSEQGNKGLDEVWMNLRRTVENVFFKREKASTHKVTLQKSGETYDLSSSQSILESLEKQGLQPRYGCRKGTCRACSVRKVSGRTNLEKGEPQPSVKICIAKPTSDLVLEL
ncbi:MAG: fatty acid desaturase [Spirochaetota bacterium]